MQQPAPERIVELAQQGVPKNVLAKTFNMTRRKIDLLLAKHVVLRKQSGLHPVAGVGESNPSAKLTNAERDNLFTMIQDPTYRFSDLARMFNISRERVRQFAKFLNAPSGTERRKVRKQTDTDQQKTRCDNKEVLQRINHEAHYDPWRKLWSQGASIAQMAKALDCSPKSVGVRITNLRKLHPDWFPYRYIRGPEAAVSSQFIEVLQEFWDEGLERAEIAKELNLSDTRLKAIIAMERARDPDSLPLRRPPLETGSIATSP